MRRHLVAITLACVAASSNAGLPEAQAAVRAKDYKTALSELEPLTRSGSAAAQNELGKLYLEGFGVPKDEVAALKLFEAAANAGFGPGESNFALMHLRGYGVPRNTVVAAAWFRKAADQGVAAAMQNLARLLEAGEGVSKDERAALALYRRSADAGLMLSQRRLGEAYTFGQLGVAIDMDQASRWYVPAAEQGERFSLTMLGMVLMLKDSGGVGKEVFSDPALLARAQKVVRDSATSSPAAREPSPPSRADCSREPEVSTPAWSGYEQVDPWDRNYEATDPARMLRAALRGDLAEVQSLLDRGVDVRSRDKRERFSGNSALDHAVRTNNVQLATLLLDRGFDVNDANDSGATALHVAAGLGRLGMMRFLIQRGARLDANYKAVGTPLDIAVVQGNACAVQLLLESKALAIQRTNPLRALSKGQEYREGHAQILEDLHAAGLNPSQRDDDPAAWPAFVDLARTMDGAGVWLARNRPELDWAVPVSVGKDIRPAIVEVACLGRSEQTLRYLLTEHKDREKLKRASVGPWGNPLHCIGMGTNYSYRSLITFLVKQGFDVNGLDAKGRKPLQIPSGYSNVKEVLVELGADPNAPDEKGNPPLFSIINGTTYGTTLIAHGADVNATNPQGRTPLFTYPYPAELLKAGAKLDVVDGQGDTPLMYRLKTNDSSLELVLAGASLSIADRTTGATPLHLAAQSRFFGRQVTSEMLKRSPLLAQSRDLAQRTPLHYAAQQTGGGYAMPGWKGTIKLLVEAGGAVNATDAEGNTPLHVACRAGSVDAMVELLDAGANPGARNARNELPVTLIPDKLKIPVPLMSRLTPI